MGDGNVDFVPIRPSLFANKDIFFIKEQQKMFCYFNISFIIAVGFT